MRKPRSIKRVAVGYLQQIQLFLNNWILPPKLAPLLAKLVRRAIPKNKKEWAYEPLPANLHDLPHFRELDKEALWISCNRESRPCICIDQSLSISVAIDGSAKRLQLGFAKKDNRSINDISVHLNGILVSSLKDIEKNNWNDIRIPLDDTLNGKIDLRIGLNGPGGIYLSHPVVCRNNTPPSGSRSAKDVICIILDGLTSSYLSANKKSTPHIWDFFKNGMICNEAYSQGDWTLPAISSMLTGLYPSNHGVYNPETYESAIPPHVMTLPEILLVNGYRTFSFSSHHRFNPAYGHAKGFERFLYRQAGSDSSFTYIINEAIAHLEAHKDEPNFLFLHLFDTHSPYKPSGYIKNVSMGSFRHEAHNELLTDSSLGDYIKYRNDERKAKLREVDLALGSLFSYLAKQPHFKNMAVVLTADHGLPEMAKGEERLSYGRTNIPLMVMAPDIRPGIDDSIIEGNVDLAPSILKAAGIGWAGGMDGKVWPFLGGQPRDAAISESLYYHEYKAVVRNKDEAFYFDCFFDYKKRERMPQKNRSVRLFKRLGGQERVEVEDKTAFQNETGSLYEKFLPSSRII